MRSTGIIYVRFARVGTLIYITRVYISFSQPATIHRFLSSVFYSLTKWTPRGTGSFIRGELFSFPNFISLFIVDVVSYTKKIMTER